MEETIIHLDCDGGDAIKRARGRALNIRLLMGLLKVEEYSPCGPASPLLVWRAQAPDEEGAW